MTNKRDKTLDKLTDEDDIVKSVDALRREAESAYEERFKEIQQNWHFYLGNHWLDEHGDPDEDFPAHRIRIQRDIVFRHVESLRPLLMRGYPKLFVSADFPDNIQAQGVPPDGELATRLTTILEAEHEYRNEGVEYAKLLLDVCVGGIGYRKIIPDLLRNEVRAQILDPQEVLPDPYGTRIDFSDHKYVIHETEMDLPEIEWRYRVKEEDFATADDEENIARREGGGLVQRLLRWTGKGAFRELETQFERKRYPLTEVYYNEATPAVFMEGNGKPPKSLKYPRGRHLVVINHKKIAIDRENPFAYATYPFTSYHSYVQPRSFMSRSDVDQLKSVQVGINVLYSRVIMNAVLMSNSQWLVEEGVVPTDWLSDKPGLIVEVAPGMIDRVRRLDPARVPRDVLELVKELEVHGQEQTALTDVVLGQEPSAGSAGIAIAQLQSAAMTRHTFRQMILDESARRQAKLEVYCLQDFINFRDPRFIRKLEFGEWLLWDEAMRNLLFDVAIESKSDLPHNLAGKIQFAFSMLQAGIFDLEEFLQFTGVKVRDDLRQKIRMASQGFLPGVQPGTEGNIPEIGQLTGVNRLGQGIAGGEPAVERMTPM